MLRAQRRSAKLMSTKAIRPRRLAAKCKSDASPRASVSAKAKIAPDPPGYYITKLTRGQDKSFAMLKKVFAGIGEFCVHPPRF